MICLDWQVVTKVKYLPSNLELLIYLHLAFRCVFCSSTQVYDAAVRWLKYDEPNRQPYMVDILAKVRFPLISKNFLSKTVQAEPLIQDNPECLKMVISKFIF